MDDSLGSKRDGQGNRKESLFMYNAINMWWLQELTSRLETFFSEIGAVGMKFTAATRTAQNLCGGHLRVLRLVNAQRWI